MFARNTPSLLKLIVILTISLVIIFSDHKTGYFSSVRYYVSYLTAPIQNLANIPHQLSEWLSTQGRSRADLMEENAQLQAQALLLKRRVQKLISLSAENIRLRELLNSSDLLEESVTVGEIIGVDQDPARHEIIINKGKSDGIYVNLPVLDASGLMGQIIEVGALSSRAILISDPNHALPVQVNRNSVRAIAVGSGSLDRLLLSHVPDTADIVVGDTLVSSGLGQRFPEGYPVGVVTRVDHDPGKAFAIVEAKPSAQLDRSRNVLLVFKEQSELQLQAPVVPGSEQAPILENQNGSGVVKMALDDVANKKKTGRMR